MFHIIRSSQTVIIVIAAGFWRYRHQNPQEHGTYSRRTTERYSLHAGIDTAQHDKQPSAEQRSAYTDTYRKGNTTDTAHESAYHEASDYSYDGPNHPKRSTHNQIIYLNYTFSPIRRVPYQAFQNSKNDSQSRSSTTSSDTPSHIHTEALVNLSFLISFSILS